jgi:anti-anti-sigma factor
MRMTTAADVSARRSPPESGADGSVCLCLTDSLVADGLADARWLFHEALRDGARSLVVDLDGVREVQSTLVASLLCAHRTCRARGGAVVLRHPDRRTLGVLRRTGLWRVLRVERDDERAAR